MKTCPSLPCLLIGPVLWLAVLLGGVLPAPAASYFYDAAGRVTAVKNANGQVFYHSYDTVGNLVAVDTDVIIPVVIGAQNLDVGMEVLLDITGGNPMGAHTYYTSVLPAGLKLDPVTGKITGIIKAKPGVYTISYWAMAGKQKSPVQQFTLTVDPFPAAMAGIFDGLLLSNATNLPAGRVEANISSTGGLTGKLLYEDGGSHPLGGAMILETDSATASIELSIKRAGTLPPLQVELTVLANQTLTVRTSARNIPQATCTDARKRLVFTTASPAPWAGLYTMLMEPSAWVPKTPDGISFASVKIDKTGSMLITAKAADGALFTGSAFGTSAGLYVHWLRPHSTAGSFFAGKLALELIPASNPAAYRATVGSGSGFFWKKMPNATDKSYALGFGPLEIDAAMLPWIPPAAGETLVSKLGLPVSGEFGSVIQGGGLDSTGVKIATGPGTLPAGTNNFADRLAIPDYGGTTATTSTTGLNKETGEPNHNSNAGGASIWWTWTPSFTGTASISTDGSNFDTVLAVYTGTAVNALTFVASDDDSGAGSQSLVNFTATAGVSYQIAVDGFSGSTGNVVLNVTPPAGTVIPAPQVHNFYGVPAWLKLDTKNKITTAENATAILTGSVNPATGIFTASFSIKDQTTVGTKTTTITRKITFQGAFLNNPGGDLGGGFTLIPGISAKEPILSGYGVLVVTPPRAKYP